MIFLKLYLTPEGHCNCSEKEMIVKFPLPAIQQRSPLSSIPRIDVPGLYEKRTRYGGQNDQP